MKIYQPMSFYFPATILCVDDDSVLLNSIELGLSPSTNIQTSSSPVSALKVLQEQAMKRQCASLLKPIDDSDTDQTFDCPVNVDLSKIIDFAYNKQRFSEIAVLVVDQSMPEMKGLDLCSQLNEYHLKKIMLTAEADNRLAIDAFNQGLIDHFIAKHDASLMAHLESAINYSRYKYFQHCSTLVIGAIGAQPVSFIQSSEFLKHFNTFLQDHAICEFYLLDSMGSYLGLDAKGQSYWFLVKSEAEMTDSLNTVVSADAVGEVAKHLKAKTHLAYCLTPEEHKMPVGEWSNLLYPVSDKVGDFYISVVQGEVSGFKPEQVLSFNDFLAKSSGAK